MNVHVCCVCPLPLISWWLGLVIALPGKSPGRCTTNALASLAVRGICHVCVHAFVSLHHVAWGKVAYTKSRVLSKYRNRCRLSPVLLRVVFNSPTWLLVFIVYTLLLHMAGNNQSSTFLTVWDAFHFDEVVKMLHAVVLKCIWCRILV